MIDRRRKTNQIHNVITNILLVITFSGVVHAAPDISAGYRYTCALTSSGGMKCWGLNDVGQLGDGTTNQSSTPVDVSGLTSGVAAISAGAYHACALTTSGGVKCWGRNNEGQVGDNTFIQKLSPTDVNGLTSGVAAISAGSYHTCALTTGGGIKCWGKNSNGQLGNNATSDNPAAEDVSGLTSGVAAISAGGSHTCALTTSGGVKCWGAGADGQLGNNTTTQSLTAVDVNGLTSGVSAISVDDRHSCALASGGARCWGYNAFGQLGDNSTLNKLTYIDVNGLASGVSALATDLGMMHSCAITTGNGAKCWGRGSEGQLGNNSTGSSLIPVDVDGLTSGVSAITMGEFHSCALLSDGSAQCWGQNDEGQLGDGSTTSSLIPVDVSINLQTAGAVFGSQQVVSTSADGALSVYAIDIDGDSDMDIISASFLDDKIAWYENDGDQNFTARTVTTSANNARSVYAIDVNGDTYIDILSASQNDNTIAWYENDGSENFTTRIISSSATGARSVYAIDMDEDGDIDVLSACYDSDEVVWYENDGSETFSTHTIAGSIDGAQSVYAIDIDGDGDIDVLSASGNDKRIIWYENDGSENFTAYDVYSSANEANTVYAIDIDGDSDIDIISASRDDDKIAWFENDGSENFTTHIIATSADGPRGVYAIDVDGDGDVDVLSASRFDSKIAWYENDGSENFTAQTISTATSNGSSVYAVDMDGDGDIDVLSSSQSDDKIAWYENGISITDVSATTANGTYTTGNTIDVTIQFTGIANVTGTPQLTLETGTTDAVVDYSSGSGTDTLTFIYTIASGHTSADLDYVSTSALTLNGGTIKDDSSHDATQTLPTPSVTGSLGANKALVVDGSVGITCAPPSQTDIPEMECDALVTLYTTTTGASWTNNTNWAATNTPCSWYGVTCSGSNVTKLDLEDNKLVGSIPAQLSNLTNLIELELDDNQLTGSIPVELGSLADLQVLNLEGNELTGSIPKELSSLSNLKELYLYENKLTGSIPEQLGNLTKLLYLEIDFNQLTGSIPTELSNLTSLLYFDLDDNQLTGSIPSELGNLINLRQFELDNNQLSGSIPTTLKNLVNVEKITLEDNQLVGGIPDFSADLTVLSELDLSGNTSLCKYPSPYVYSGLWNTEASAYADCVLAPPSNFTATATSQSQINLSWNDESSFETGFVITRNGTVITTKGENAESYNNTDLTCGTTQNYTIHATDGVIDSTTVSASATTNNCIIVNKPNAPINFNATTISDTTIDLTWTDDSTIESSYLLYRDGNRIVRLPTDSESYQDTNLTCETTYTYSLIADGQAGESEPVIIEVQTATCPDVTTTPVTDPTTDPTNPNPTTDPVTNPNIGLNPPTQLAATLQSDNSIYLTWLDNSYIETGFIVLRDNQPWATLPINTASFADNQINCGLTYNYTVMATNGVANSEPVNVSIVAPICDTHLATPYNVTATPQLPSTISLTWSDDNSQANYLIQRDGIVLTTVSEKNLIDSQRQCGQSYTYTVQAVTADKISQPVSTQVQMPACVLPINPELTTPEPIDNNLQLNLFTEGKGDVIGCGRQCVQQYAPATVLTLKAKAANSWEFNGWSGDCDSIGQIVINGNQQCTAHFTPIVITQADEQPDIQTEVILQLYTKGQGSIQNCGLACTQIYPQGATVTLNPVPTSGWIFTGWQDDCHFSYVHLYQDTVCTAIFEPLPDLADTPQPTNSVLVPINNGYITDAYIPPNASVSNVYLLGKNISEGLVSNATIELGAVLQGGRLSNVNRSKGTVQDINIRPYSLLEGGYVTGTIQNDGELRHVTIEEGTIVTGSGILSGTINNAGVIENLILEADTVIIGGELIGDIIGDAKQPATIGAATIHDATIEHICLTPTVQLGDNVTLGANVTVNTGGQSILDFCIQPTQILSIPVTQLEPAAIATWTPEMIKALPPIVFSLFSQSQLSQLQLDVVRQISPEQFHHIQVTALDGFTPQAWEAFSSDIIQQLTTTQLLYVDTLNSENVQTRQRAASKILTNVSPQVWEQSHLSLSRFLPEGWKVDTDTQEIRPLPNSFIVYKSMGLTTLPQQVDMAEVPDFNAGFGIGGKGSPLINQVNAGVSQTRINNEQASDLLKNADFSKFKLLQQENGILNVQGTEQYADLLFSFLPDVTGIHTVTEEEVYVGLSQTTGGFFQITMPNKQQFVMLPAPTKPDELGTIFGEQAKIQISQTAEVFIRYADADGKAQSLIVIFDPFVKIDKDAEPLSFITDVSTLRAIREGRVVFSDGSSQNIYPAVLYPNALIDLLTQAGAENVIYNVDGTINLIFNGQSVNLLPTYDTQVQPLEIWERVEASIGLDSGELVYSVQDKTASQLVTMRLVISF
ncbi:FG-GAP-like repeat-containing protein [Candidatus Albibeggiatoa sp. nov. NOAA]|uniref:RCC1 domain-containing protein n=1 Tax=Candidatus Albibeggiatoa sp. nov. NOAA TaxID=3162724 RepID=UPI003302F47C|nr:FG-GAP-like repeat-containing protein [Thiotrichaceae bacterium]